MQWLGGSPDDVCDVPEEQDCGFPRQDPVEITPMTTIDEERSGDPDQEKNHSHSGHEKVGRIGGKCCHAGTGDVAERNRRFTIE